MGPPSHLEEVVAGRSHARRDAPRAIKSARTQTGPYTVTMGLLCDSCFDKITDITEIDDGEDDESGRCCKCCGIGSCCKCFLLTFVVLCLGAFGYACYHYRNVIMGDLKRD